jgi:integrase
MTIRKIGDRYELRRSVMIDGKEHAVRRRFRTRAEAVTADAELTRRHRNGGIVHESTITLAEHLAEWLESAKNLKPSTRDSYRNAITAYINPTLGTVQLRRLTTARLQAWIDGLERSGRVGGGYGGESRRGQPLSPKTVANIHGILHKGLTRAVQLRRIEQNPADNLELPRRTAQPRRSATLDELAAILQACDGDRFDAVWRLLFMTGMRRGELRALRWSDVNLEAGSVTVSRSTVRVAGQDRTEQPKTRHGLRVISIDADTVAALRRWYKAQGAERMAAGESWQGGDRRDCLIITEPDGTPTHPSAFRRRYDALLRRAGVRRLVMHEARHTAVTVGMLVMRPEEVSRRTGHRSAAYTLDAYWHALPDFDRDGIERLADELRERGSRSRRQRGDVG